MDIDLKGVLKGASAIPYSPKLIDLLGSICTSYRNDDKLSFVDELIVAFVSGIIPVRFREFVLSKLSENGYNEIPTDEIYVRLAQYIVIIEILNNDNNLERAILASKLMNYILAAKAFKRPIPNQDLIRKTYDFHLSKYIKDIDDSRKFETSDLRQRVYESNFSLQIEEEETKSLFQVFKESELYRIDRLLKSDKIQNIENPFVRVYMGLSSLFDSLPYLFYDLNVKHIISVLDKDENKRKKLSNIVSELYASKLDLEHSYSQTSVILSMLDGKATHNIGEVMLTLREFAIYLYYELLTEKIIHNQN